VPAPPWQGVRDFLQQSAQRLMPRRAVGQDMVATMVLVGILRGAVGMMAGPGVHQVKIDGM
jgi:hypothetical protein